MPITRAISAEQREALIAELSSHGVPHAEELARLAAASVKIAATRADGPLPPGASRFGGAPDVPAGFSWPTWDGRPLSFLAQLDLAELRHPELPSEGWLLFFYDCVDQPWGFDPEDAGCARVIHVTGERSALVRQPHPDGEDAEGGFDLCRLTFTDAMDLPYPEDLVFAPVRLSLDDEAHKAYVAVACADDDGGDDPLYHHLFGHPQLIQGDMRDECQLVTNGIYCGNSDAYRDARAPELLKGAGEWRLLLQLDTDEDGPGWMWGDCGRLFFWIKQADLSARAFDRAWVVLQCF